MVKNLPANAGDARGMGSICGWGRSPGVGNGKLLQFSCLETPMDRGTWWASVYRVAKSQTWMSTCAHTHIHCVCYIMYQFSSVQSLSHVWLFATPWIAAPQPPLHRQLPEFTPSHVHWVGDAIQPSHPLASPSPPAPNPSQHQSLFQWVNTSHEVAKVLEFQLQHQSFQRTPRVELL